MSMPTRNPENWFILKSNLKRADVPHVKKKMDHLLYLHFLILKFEVFPQGNRIACSGGADGEEAYLEFMCVPHGTWGKLGNHCPGKTKGWSPRVPRALENTGLLNRGQDMSLSLRVWRAEKKLLDRITFASDKESRLSGEDAGVPAVPRSGWTAGLGPGDWTSSSDLSPLQPWAATSF